MRKLRKNLESQLASQLKTRLGKVWEGDESRRPLRVIYNNIEEKERVTSVLGNLQNAPDRFMKIRISNDYNPEERE